MFVQFFGGFLLNKGAVTREQLIDAMEKESTSHIQLGTLAMHAGLMDAEQIEDVRISQTHTDKRFGEICVDKGYLTESQVDELLARYWRNKAYLTRIRSTIWLRNILQRILFRRKIFPTKMKAVSPVWSEIIAANSRA